MILLYWRRLASSMSMDGLEKSLEKSEEGKMISFSVT